MKQLITFLVAPLLASQAIAQQDPSLEEEQQEEIRRYSAEVIIFSYAEDVSVGSEVFVPDIIRIEDPATLNDAELIFDDTTRPATGQAIDDIAEPELRDPELVMLGREELTMIEIRERFERLDVYEPLMHFGWTQATWPEEDTLPIELGTFARPPPGLTGDLTLYLGRYLHLVVNLALDESPGVAGSDPVNDYYDERMLADSGIETLEGPVRFRIEEDRIIKRGEIRYFDHPKFGVIAKVTRVEEEDAAGLPDQGGESIGRRP